MLGQLYLPSGPALETAQAVLQVEKPMSCNVAYGCLNGCSYCFLNRRWKSEFRVPKARPVDLVKKQIERKGIVPEGVFASFCTDAFLRAKTGFKMCGEVSTVIYETEQLIEYLAGVAPRIATLSKLDVSDRSRLSFMRNGMTIVSLDRAFWRKHEPKTMELNERINLLRGVHDRGGYTWVNVEPYPPPALWKQDLTQLLEAVSFVDFMAFGKLNYDAARASTKEARVFYREAVATFEQFCMEHKIRSHVKSGTRRFIGDKRHA